MPDATAVVARFSTDRGPVVVRTTYTGDLAEALTGLARKLEEAGVFPVRLLRVYTQTVPVVQGDALWPLASAPVRVPEGMFRIMQEMPA